MIKLQVIGHLGKDCTVNEVNGKSVINFNVAHSERFKDAQGTQVEKTTWVNCSYWTDRTAVAPYLKKGQLIFTEGTPEVETYTNKEGQQAANLRLRVSSIQLLGGKTDDNQGASGQQQQSHQSSGGQSAGNQSSGNHHSSVAQTSATETHSQVSEPADDLPF